MTLYALSIRRPVLATVMSIVIVIFGAIGFFYLGVREYPAVDPPVISVSTSYRGANAEVIDSQGLTRFYEFRSEPALKPADDASGDRRFSVCDRPEVRRRLVRPIGADECELRFLVDGESGRPQPGREFPRLHGRQRRNESGHRGPPCRAAG